MRHWLRGAINTAVGGVSGLVAGALVAAKVGVRTAAGIGVVTDSLLDTGAQVALGEVQAGDTGRAFATNLAANTLFLGAGAGAGKLLDKFRGGKSGAGSAPVGDARQTVREHPSGERASGRPSAAPNPARQGQTQLLLANPETPVSRRLTAGSPTVATQGSRAGGRGDQSAFAEIAEDAVSRATGVPRNQLGTGEFIPDATRVRADGTPRRYYLDLEATGRSGSLARRGSIIEVKASGIEGGTLSALSGRSRRQVRTAVDYARELRARTGRSDIVVELFTDLSVPSSGPFASAVDEGILVLRPIPR